MPIHIANRRTKPENLRKKFGVDIVIVDVTSKAPQPWVKLSPFWPHGDIPVPFSLEFKSESVEGVWQALKVFESEDVDESKLRVANMKGLKRTMRRLGSVRGHRQGMSGDELLDYHTARVLIYLPTYRWMLENCVGDVLDQLREIATSQPVVLLDYTTNGDIENLRTPLSHAALVKRFLEDDWPA